MNCHKEWTMLTFPHAQLQCRTRLYVCWKHVNLEAPYHLLLDTDAEHTLAAEETAVPALACQPASSKLMLLCSIQGGKKEHHKVEGTAVLLIGDPFKEMNASPILCRSHTSAVHARAKCWMPHFGEAIASSRSCGTCRQSHGHRMSPSSSMGCYARSNM